ncbi:DUF2851 family protein [Bacteroides acidifaciens]|jgi:hypothetical protein|uniref:DUF2851 family protein n=2 Tax=Bacteroides acidifaciens TaxID=85831 RepID=A0A3L7Z5X7_9BACE|nr:DUF2851 family protein [Bacteroides acidifaciens]MBF0728940.1 DUF2851 family protein [Bacteroides acidifaciens]MBF0837079.1 DUF2851 family protein [Bacteroides acidifaciens]MCR1996405.1 DUF2851 family protein [Bacteroides acidifaciens]NDO52966.1 DUF2851 family protein [Bacteroides acidifaciens]RLT81036.1 DUF2851 family protein [Bacteroides acidifaciens]
MEHLLHYVWKHKLFPLKVLQTTNGLPVEVIDPGLQNPNAGPDFFNAKLKINGILWVGNIEIHAHASDWFHHGHDSDKVYDSVILHVVGEADGEITRTNGEVIPQLQLTCPEHIRAHYHELCVADQYPACYPVLASLPKLTVHSWLTALQTERLEQKARLITQRLEHCNNNWEDAFFITLARNFGFGLNGDAFETWAGLLPLRAVDKHRNDLFQIEALFYGLAGLFEDTFLKKEQEDEYSLRLCKEFRYLQRKFEFTRVMDATLWRFLRLRPENFPHIRLAQLAYLYQKGDKLFSRLLEAETLSEVRELLTTRTSAYWESHYLFGQTSPHKEKTLGERSKNLIIINTVTPFLYTYGLHKADERMCERAGRFLEELKAEDNHITRAWSNAGLPVATAADSQALIQLRKEYCDKRKCLFCRFGYEYLRHE